MKTTSTFILIFILFSISLSAQHADKILPLIPYPAQVVFGDGTFTLSSNTKVVVSDQNLINEVSYFNAYLKTNYGLQVGISKTIPANGNYIELTSKNSEQNDSESYQLEIVRNHIKISAETGAGTFYGLQTLIQLLPLKQSSKLQIPCVTIKDFPRYKWRGMHLDCSRHFFEPAFIKKYIDCLASYKMNVFHWHLTDDQGWRIEIKQYPRLTEVGAWRKGSMIGIYSDNKFDLARYGGFYTQDEIREIVAYAQQRHVSVVPEIEMPGHALAALAAYPEYSCSGLPAEVGMKWGIETNVFCPTEQTFGFLENILTEGTNLFPSRFIHIGGDEVLKDEWNKSPFCLDLMKTENLKDAHELQAYFIRRIEKIVNSKGRMIIGWDEILEGGLAPNAAVMSWRGTEGGIAAAKEHHFVVMSPGSHCYFDHYQGNPEYEPLAIGGFTPVEKTYSYEPTPDTLTEAEAGYILGAQGNVWTEYINNTTQVEYMAIPRMAALAEVVWSKKELRNFDHFKVRLHKHFNLLDKWNVNYSNAAYEVKSTVMPGSAFGVVYCELSCLMDSAGIRYTTDGTEPNPRSAPYVKPLVVGRDQVIKAACFEGGKQKHISYRQVFTISKSTNKPIQLLTVPAEKYKGTGAFTLVNGVRGNLNRISKEWLGFKGQDVELIVDLGKQDTLAGVELDILIKPESKILAPAKVTVYGSEDGINFRELKSISPEEINISGNTLILKFEKTWTRYIKVTAENAGSTLDGSKLLNWLFIDEIIIL